MNHLLRAFFCVLAVVLTRPLAVAAEQQTGAARVTVANGVLEGTVTPDGVRSFKGIPYALPPMGSLRWKEPQPAAHWEGVRGATRFGAHPNQPHLWKDMIFRSESMSEDCLYLNVWTRGTSSADGLPVLVYFHGGGLIAGDGSEPRYDGASMARMGIVVVTVNYRLGVFGFYSHPELTLESPHHASGNYGHLDQVEALRWVQRNIAVFGGDPHRVTIAGQSAGAASVCALMASPLGNGLFEGAIGESGSMLGNPTAVTLAQGEKEGLVFAAKAGAPSLAALRSLPEDRLLALAKGMSFARRVLLDGYFFTETPEEVFFTGRQADVPVLAGWNTADISGPRVLDKVAATPANFAAAVKSLYGDRAPGILALYPSSTPALAEQAASDLSSDRTVGYRTWKWTDMHAKSGGKPVFRYFFSQLLPRETEPSAAGTATPAVVLGVPHSAEIPYALGNLPLISAYQWTAADFKASSIMQGYFANFVKTGNPNGPGLPHWSWMQASIPQVMILSADAHLAPEEHLERYEFMDAPSP